MFHVVEYHHKKIRSNISNNTDLTDNYKNSFSKNIPLKKSQIEQMTKQKKN